MDRSWTIYHVSTGIPARVDGSALTDLSRSAATDGMLSLNLRKRQTLGRPEHPAEIGLEGSQTRVSIMTLAFPNPSQFRRSAELSPLFRP
jgi:hypothetical protein